MYTYCTNIDNVENLIESFDPDVKRQIKKLEQDDILVKSDDSIDVFYDLQEKSFKRQERSFNLNKSQFAEFLTNINLENCYKVYTIYQGKTPVYSSIVLLYKSIAYYWLAGGDPDYFAKGHNKLLLKEIILNLNKEGYKNFDFIGANTPSISKYKSNFGFELTPYYYVEKTNSKILRLLLTIKSIIK
jgi:lipid II:glycine glycyltransferase (peptidoglycan interpeptide bridge formation enzyme)